MILGQLYLDSTLLIVIYSNLHILRNILRHHHNNELKPIYNFTDRMFPWNKWFIDRCYSKYVYYIDAQCTGTLEHRSILSNILCLITIGQIGLIVCSFLWIPIIILRLNLFKRFFNFLYNKIVGI